MTSSATQLPLRLTPQQLFRFDNFYFNHAELKPALTELCQSEQMSFVYLWGEPSSGKSHLLLAVIENTALRSLYLPLADLVNSASPDILSSLEELDLLCIDDLQAIAGLKEWEEALFHCFNRLQLSGCKLLIAAQQNPATVALSLPDLRSRLATGLVYQLDALNDDDKLHALILQAQSRGLEMSEEVANYLLRHHSRDMSVLISLLMRLDKASMVAKRRLTIPFIRQTLNG